MIKTVQRRLHAHALKIFALFNKEMAMYGSHSFLQNGLGIVVRSTDESKERHPFQQFNDCCI